MTLRPQSASGASGGIARRPSRRSQSAMTQIELWPQDESSSDEPPVSGAGERRDGFAQVQPSRDFDSTMGSPPATTTGVGLVGHLSPPRGVEDVSPVLEQTDGSTAAPFVTEHATPSAGALEALRRALESANPLVVEHDWDGYFAYGAPRIFAYLWPHATHVTLGLLQGARLRPASVRLVGRGPALRTVAVRSALDVDPELKELISRAAERAVRDGMMR